MIYFDEKKNHPKLKNVLHFLNKIFENKKLRNI